MSLLGIMKILRLPPVIRALAFDVDLTLYTNAEYGQYQIDILIKKAGELRGFSSEEMSGRIEDARKDWSLANGGKKASLSNALTTYGISMEENVRLREQLYEPEKYIKEDKRLRETLDKLSRSYTLGVVTNNPVLIARKTLAALGVSDLFPILVGLDTCMVSKPHEKPFVKFSELSGCAPETCVSVGDRYDIDLATPLEMGMGGILVDGVDDVYELAKFLL